MKPDSEIRFYFPWAEGNPERRFHSNRSAVFHGGLELPLGNCFAGKLVEAIIDAAEHANPADCTIGKDDGMQYDRAADILLHQFQRISRVNFQCGHR